MNKNLFKNLLVVLIVGIVASFVPFLWISAMFGFPAVVMNTLLIGIIFNKELSKETA